MSITYVNGKLTAVTDGAGRVFTFAYDSSDHLMSITAPDSSVIHYTYDGCDNLSGIAYPDNGSVSITNVFGELTEVVLKDAENIATYAVRYDFTDGRVSKATEFGVENGDYVIGSTSEYTYSVAANRTEVLITDLSDTDCEPTDTVKTVYNFDSEGNVVGEYAYTEDLGNIGVESSGSGINPFNSDGDTSVVSNIDNMLRDHDFYSLSNWNVDPCNCGNLYMFLETNEQYAKYGSRMLCIRSYV